MDHEHEQRLGYAGDTPAGNDDGAAVESDRVTNERRRIEQANIHGMQGAGTSAGGETAAHWREPGGGAPTVSGLSEFDDAGRPQAPEHGGGGELGPDTRPASVSHGTEGQP